MEESTNIQTQSTPAEAQPSSPAPSQPQGGFLSGPPPMTPFDPVAFGRRSDTPAEPVEPDPLGIASQRATLARLGYGADTDATNEIIRAAEEGLRQDSLFVDRLEALNAWYRKAAEAEAAGDRLEWARIITSIAPMERRLQREFADAITKRVGGKRGE